MTKDTRPAPGPIAVRRYPLLGGPAAWYLPLLAAVLAAGAVAFEAFDLAIGAAALGWLVHRLTRSTVLEISPPGLTRGLLGMGPSGRSSSRLSSRCTRCGRRGAAASRVTSSREPTPAPSGPDRGAADKRTSRVRGRSSVHGRRERGRRGLLQSAAGTEDRHRDDGSPDRGPPAQRSRPADDRRWGSRRCPARALTGEDGLDHSGPRRHRAGRPPLARVGRRRVRFRERALLLARPALEPPHEQIEQRHQHEYQQEEDLLGPERPHGGRSPAIASDPATEAPVRPRRSLPAWWCRPARSSSGSSP